MVGILILDGTDRSPRLATAVAAMLHNEYDYSIPPTPLSFL
jgi:hypothetical protein